MIYTDDAIDLGMWEDMYFYYVYFMSCKYTTHAWILSFVILKRKEKEDNT